MKDVTGFPEMMNGRVKTLHPAVHGGLLALRHNDEHLAEMTKHGIRAIDLLVVNLYPFSQTIAKPNCSDLDAIENIDIGGPAMIRSAGKNHEWCLPVVNPRRYSSVVDALKKYGSVREMPPLYKRRMAAEAFAHTAAYDATIAGWMLENTPVLA